MLYFFYYSIFCSMNKPLQLNGCKTGKFRSSLRRSVLCFVLSNDSTRVYMSEAYSFPLKSCVPCTVTLDARSGQRKCIMEENGCESRQTSKEKTLWLRFMLEGSRPCLHRTHVGWITLPFPFYWSELWPGILGIRIVWYVINTRFHQLFGRRSFSVTEYHMN